LYYYYYYYYFYYFCSSSFSSSSYYYYYCCDYYDYDYYRTTIGARFGAAPLTQLRYQSSIPLEPGKDDNNKG